MNSDIIAKRMLNDDKFTQIDYNQVIIGIFKKIDKPSMADRREYHNSIFGGVCFYCGKSWRKVVNKTAFLDFVFYKPVCECIEIKKEKNKDKKIKSVIVENCNIPTKYKTVTICKMDKNVKKETIEAINKVKEYVNNRIYNNSGLLLFGDVGTGKTHLAVSVLKAIVIKEGKRGWFVNVAGFINDVFYSHTNFIKEIINHDVVVLDDIDKAFTGKDSNERSWRKEQFFNLIDGLVNNKRIIIMTSNVKSIKELSDHYEDAIVSRIMRACDKYIAVKGYDYQLKKKGII